YLTSVPPAIGILVILAAIWGLWVLRKNNDWREKLLVLWIIVPVAFFQLWPTKGFQYLLPIAPAVALLAGRTLAHWPQNDFRLGRIKIPQRIPGLVLACIVAVTLFLPSWQSVASAKSDIFVAGTGGIPGARETGRWLSINTPDGITFAAIGPS